MWVLLLNDMRMPKIEMLEPVARAETKEALIAYLGSQEVETYQDGQWNKVYRKGGSLEWYNPPSDDLSFRDVGHEDDWAANARQRYRDQVLSIPAL
jgi:hypothetical protein